MSAIVQIRDHRNRFVKARALLDTCATANFISESIVKRLDSQVVEHQSLIGAINTISTESKGLVKITMRSRFGDFGKELICLTIPIITDLVPSEVFPTVNRGAIEYTVSRSRIPFAPIGRFVNRVRRHAVIVFRRTNKPVSGRTRFILTKNASRLGRRGTSRGRHVI